MKKHLTSLYPCSHTHNSFVWRRCYLTHRFNPHSLLWMNPKIRLTPGLIPAGLHWAFKRVLSVTESWCYKAVRTTYGARSSVLFLSSLIVNKSPPRKEQKQQSALNHFWLPYPVCGPGLRAKDFKSATQILGFIHTYAPSLYVFTQLGKAVCGKLFRVYARYMFQCSHWAYVDLA